MLVLPKISSPPPRAPNLGLMKSSKHYYHFFLGKIATVCWEDNPKSEGFFFQGPPSPPRRLHYFVDLHKWLNN